MIPEYKIVTNGEWFRIKVKKKRWFGRGYKWEFLKIYIMASGIIFAISGKPYKFFIFCYPLYSVSALASARSILDSKCA